MKPSDKHPYEPPVTEVFELKTEGVLSVVSPNQSYEPTDENPLVG